MTLRTTLLPIGALLALTASCNLDKGLPPPVPVEITIDFCENDAPIWFAYQTRNNPWAVGFTSGGATYTFTAEGQTAIAFVRQREGSYRTEVIFTNSLDLEDISGLECVEEIGTKQVNGTTSGITDPEIGLIAMGFSNTYVTEVQNSFSLTQLVDRPLDLVASRIDVTGGEQQANKVVIRRAQNPASGTSLATINFGLEGFQPASNTVGVSGIGANDFAYLVNNFFSQLETSHILSTVDGISDGLFPIVSIPTSQQVAGDYHDVFAIASAPTGSVRGVEQYFTKPANQSIVLGPDLLDPIISIVATEPHLRLRTEIDGQVEYSTVISTEFRQQTQFFTIEFVMTVSASFMGGTPFVWDLPMPNFTGLDEWNDAWALQPGEVEWTVTGYYGRPALLFGAKPDSIETVSFASQSGSTSAAQAFKVGRPAPRRPIIARWR
jgi:hypothetical protein